MSTSHSPAKQTTKQSPSADQKAQQQAAQELSKPGTEHAQLEKFVGTWKTSYTHWMSPDAEPVKATGKATITSVFDGRFIHEEFTGEFQGKPFNGVGTTGFDRAAKRFVNTWYDNVSTGLIYSSGPATSNQKEIVLRGEMTCPINGQIKVRHVYTQESDKKFTLTMYNEKDGKENKGMEVVYTR